MTISDHDHSASLTMTGVASELWTKTSPALAPCRQRATRPRLREHRGCRRIHFTRRTAGSPTLERKQEIVHDLHRTHTSAEARATLFNGPRFSESIAAVRNCHKIDRHADLLIAFDYYGHAATLMNRHLASPTCRPQHPHTECAALTTISGAIAPPLSICATSNREVVTNRRRRRNALTQRVSSEGKNHFHGETPM